MAITYPEPSGTCPVRRVGVACPNFRDNPACIIIIPLCVVCVMPAYPSSQARFYHFFFGRKTWITSEFASK